MLRGLIVAAASASVLLAATSASAQEKAFGQKGQLTLSADRLIPLFAYDSFKVSLAGNSTETTTQSSFSVLPNVNSFQVQGRGGLAVFYNVPRLSVDFAVIDNLTIGGSVILYFTAGGSVTTANGGQSQSTDTPSGLLFGFAPRVGYTLHLTDLFTFWPRAGVAYYTASVKSTSGTGNTAVTTTDSINQFAINLEPIFAFTPIPHFYLFAGPVLDIPITGSLSQKTEPAVGQAPPTQSNDTSMLHFGITAGLGGYFNL